MGDFMKDRNGADELTTAMGFAGMALALIGSLASIKALSWFGLAAVLLAIARAISKNLEARRRENDKYLEFIAKLPFSLPRAASSSAGGRKAASTARSAKADDLKRQARTAKKMWKERKTKSFLKCPTCGTTLAVPKGKGKLIVTCPKCHTKMETRS